LLPQAPADGLLVISVRTEGGTQRERARVQVRDAVVEVLAAVLGVPAADISVQARPGQAPSVALAGRDERDGSIGCSFSHEDGLSLAAINLHGDVGVDIMRVAGIPDWLAVARDYLGPGVTADLLALPAEDLPRAFAQAWAANEARLKCEGRQLSEWLPAGSRIAAPDQPQVHACSLALPDGFAGEIVWTTSA
jgi:4'-phosphopantetheinyl transferase